MSIIAPGHTTVTSEKDRKRLRELLTVDDTAGYLQCAPLTVRRMISRGELKAVRFGRNIRIKPADIEKVLKPVTNASMLRGGDVDVA